MNISEANNLNTLLRYLLAYDRYNMQLPSAESAMLAAEMLADKANKALMAGFNGNDVSRLWIEAAPRPAIRERKAARP